MKGTGSLDVLLYSDKKIVRVNLEDGLVVSGIRYDLFALKAGNRSGGDFPGKDGEISLLGGTLHFPI